jgi:hypothetical protein
MKLVPLALSLVLFSASGMAAEGLKPGQWEMTVNMKMKNMPQISPEEMAAMKEMGIEMPGMGKPMTMQQCITPELAAKAVAPSTPDLNCTVRNIRTSGNKTTGEMVCAGDPKMTGKFETITNGNTSYRSKMTLKGISQGQPIDQEIENSGKWVKAQCDPGLQGK